MVKEGTSSSNGMSSFPEQELLQTFDKKLQLIRDRVTSVVCKYASGVYFVGRPGTSKTHTVRDQLGLHDVPWLYQNARMTPMGLFETIAEHPDHIIVLDDIVSLFNNDQTMQILMAALDGEPTKPRSVKYRTKDTKQTVLFTGAVIAISNIPLRSDPLARALGSRIAILEHEPSDAEIAAFIRKLAKDGFAGLSPDDCIDVAEFIVAETRECDLRLDLRHFSKALQDLRQYQNGHSRTPWQDLVRTSLQKLATEPVGTLPKKNEIEIQRQKVRDAIRKHPTDRVAQCKATGLSRSTFYIRRKEVLAEYARAGACTV